ncbi:MAG: hypothetical protein ACRCXL_16035 [Dermatophilaceae bacterium]
MRILDLDDRTHAVLAACAAEAGTSVSELLRDVAIRMASRPALASGSTLTSQPTVTEWLESTRRRSSPVGRAEIAAALDEHRGSWPDAGR